MQFCSSEMLYMITEMKILRARCVESGFWHCWIMCAQVGHKSWPSKRLKACLLIGVHYKWIVQSLSMASTWVSVSILSRIMMILEPWDRLGNASGRRQACLRKRWTLLYPGFSECLDYNSFVNTNAYPTWTLHKSLEKLTNVLWVGRLWQD